MSKGSTEVDGQETAVSDRSYNEEQQKTIQDILIHCQGICDAIQDLDKKVDIIHGKVSKLYRSRCRMKSVSQNRKLRANRYKNYNYQHSRKSKCQKRRRRERPSSLSNTASYSPTIPVSRRDNDSQSNALGTSCESQKPPEWEQESLFQDQEPGRNQSPEIPTVFSRPCQPYGYAQEDPVQGPSSLPSHGSAWTHSTSSVFPLNQATPTPPATILTQVEPEPIPNPDVVTYPPLFDNQGSRHTSTPPCMPSAYAPTSPVRHYPDLFRENFPEDPSTWSVDEVVTFLQDVDPETLAPLADLFRKHGIDGKALPLLRSDMMIKYMGLNLGTALKLCHYIEGLKEGRYIYNL